MTYEEEKAVDRAEMHAELEGRAQFYRMLSKLYRKTLTQEELDALDGDEFRVLSSDTANALMSEGFNDMYRYLRKRNTGTREELGCDFTRCFMGSATYRGLTGRPFASLYLESGGGRLMGEPRNAVKRVYKSQCIKLVEGIDLPEDHLAFECEFMAIINERAADALESGNFAKVREQLALQSEFLDNHILNWVDRFFHLSMELLRTRFYRGVVKLTKGFLSDEPATIDFLLGELDNLGKPANSQTVS